MIEFKNLCTDDYDKFIALYEASFPEEERRPYAGAEDLRQFVWNNKEMFKIIGLYADGKFAGFISIWHFDGYIYGEHAAVLPELRGTGLGAKMFEHVLRCESPRMLLEVEPAGSTPMAARRIAFYERLGFRVRHDVHYVQPPYSPGLPPVELWLMTQGDVDLSDPDKALRPLRHHVYCAE